MAEYQVKNMREKHRELLRHIVADPAQSNKELAQKIRVTPGWVSIVRNSDVFKAIMERVQEDMDVQLSHGIVDQLGGVASQTIERLHELVPQSNDIKELTDVMDSALDRLGYSPKRGAPSVTINQQNNQQNTYGMVPQSVLEEVQEKMGKKYDYEVSLTPEIAQDRESNSSAEDGESAPLGEGNTEPESGEASGANLRKQDSGEAGGDSWQVFGSSSVD